MKKVLLLFFFGMLLSACNPKEVPEEYIPEDANRYAKHFLNKFHSGDLDYCYNKMVEQFRNDEAKLFFNQAYAMIKYRELLSSKIVNSQMLKATNKDIDIYSLVYENAYSDSLWVYYTFRLIKEDNEFKVLGFFVKDTDESITERNEFSFKNKSFKHYLWFFLVILVPVFIVLTFGFILFMPVKQKWFWLLFVLLGFVTFSLNWTSGAVTLKPISLKLLGAGFVQYGLTAPWIISFTIPVGAIVFWIRRNQLIHYEDDDELLEQ